MTRCVSYRDHRIKPVLIIVFLAVAALTLLVAGGKAAKEPVPSVNPRSDVESLCRVVIPDDVPEIWLRYEGFNVSFNPAHHQPNYSSWELTGEEVDGAGERKSNFRADKDVYGCATLADYRNSGYDRGHMAPAADMKWSTQAMADCHYLTNICPQDRKVNGGIWNTLENKCRAWAERDSAIIIICGPVLSDYMPKTIGQSQVSVPARFFKVVLAPFTNPPRAVGFIIPNYPVDATLESMSMSVDDVEAATDFDFFSALPDDIENFVESRNSYGLMNVRSSR